MRALGWSMVIGGTAALVHLVRLHNRAVDLHARASENLKRVLKDL